MLSIFTDAIFIIFIYATVWFIVSIALQRNDIADVAWGMGYIVLVIYFLIGSPVNTVATIMASLVIIWGMRLSIHIYFRNKGKTEDFRYYKWRKEWGRNFYLRSYLQVFLLQGLILLVIISPVLAVIGSNGLTWSWVTSIGVITWLFGFIYETVADLQLKRFVRRRKNASDIMQAGLWRFSRHPNYFGEIVMWWGIFICAIPLEYSLLLLISPVTITYLLVYVSGVPMIEQKYQDHAQYQKYRRNTPVIFPKFW